MKVLFVFGTRPEAIKLAPVILHLRGDAGFGPRGRVTAQHREMLNPVLITGHRRESFGRGFEAICTAMATLSQAHPDVAFVYPVHLNPNVQEPVRRILSERSNMHLLDPLGYAAFAWLMQRSTLILTDSGGIQEEAPSLGKPVLVMRNTTERPEGVEAGCVQLVGTETDRIVAAACAHLAAPDPADRTTRHNPYGDGHVAERIADALVHGHA